MFLFSRFFGYNKIPKELRRLYKGCIRNHFELNNGWAAIVLNNDMLHLYNGVLPFILVGGFKRLFEAEDGKFMIINDDGLTAVYLPSGDLIANFAKNNCLFKNGWYRQQNEDTISLFKTNGELVAQNLVNAKVFKDGRYILLYQDKAVFYAPNGTVLTSCHKDFLMLWNGWYIADNVLYDNQNKPYFKSSICKGINAAVLHCVCPLRPKRN